MLAEPYDENPYLPQVYAGRTELALDSQLFFLTSRVRQLNGSTLARGRAAITDYIFDKELIYAKRLLDPQQFASYQGRYEHLAAKVPAPVLAIYMQARQDDRSLIEKFGDDYRRYVQAVPRMNILAGAVRRLGRGAGARRDEGDNPSD